MDQKVGFNRYEEAIKKIQNGKKHSSLALLVKKLYFYLNVLSKLKNDKLYLFYME